MKPRIGATNLPVYRYFYICTRKLKEPPKPKYKALIVDIFCSHVLQRPRSITGLEKNIPLASMNTPLVQFVLAASVCLAVHLGSMTLSARILGITVLRVSYGIGPTLYSGRLLQLKAFPLAGYVKLKDSREDSIRYDELADAFDHQPVWKQVFVPLVGNAALLLFAIAVLGVEGWSSFTRGFLQVFQGALDPFSTAQIYLESAVRFAHDRSAVSMLALVASKVAAINLLPFGTFNGWQALLTVIRQGGPPLRYEESIQKLGLLVTLVLLVFWALAVGSFASNH